MAASGSQHGSPSRRQSIVEDDESILGTGVTSRQIEAFGRKVTTTAGHLIGPLGGDPTGSTHYQSAMTDLQRSMRRPGLQRSVFSFAHTTPSDLVRSKLSTSEIQSRALTYVPDALLANIPPDENTYSLFQGFQASLPDSEENEHRKRRHRRRSSRGQRLSLLGGSDDGKPPSLEKLKRERDALNHRLEMMGVRKNMCSSEIREIDNKISNLNNMRKIVLDRLAGLELDETQGEHELLEMDSKIEIMEEELEDTAALNSATPRPEMDDNDDETSPEKQAMNASFMSESIYEKLPSPKSKRPKTIKRKLMPILHEHFEPGSMIKELPAHNDTITALDFDVPFGTMITAALDDTVRVWDLNLGRCMGFLEGHHASVRCLQVEDNLVATGSKDASVRLWDLSRAKYAPEENRMDDEEDDGLGFDNPEDEPPPPPASVMEDCALFSLDAHVDDVTALYFRGDTLVSGSADKTLRQWDLVKGRCVQTLDVLWAAAQASVTMNSSNGQWRQTGRTTNPEADFVGALQCFEAALACGTADGMVRLWDLRSGQVHRSLVGHTGPVTALQFDDVHLVTGSVDRSIRIWDLRTGSIHDAYAYDNPITSMMFDARRIVSAACEDVVKVYDKTDGRHWDCGAGVTAAEDLDHHTPAVVERVRIKDGYLIEGRKDGMVGIWTC